MTTSEESALPRLKCPVHKFKNRVPANCDGKDCSIEAYEFCVDAMMKQANKLEALRAKKAEKARNKVMDCPICGEPCENVLTETITPDELPITWVETTFICKKDNKQFKDVEQIWLTEEMKKMATMPLEGEGEEVNV